MQEMSGLIQVPAVFPEERGSRKSRGKSGRVSERVWKLW
jgi:hypothetical protein